MAAERLIDRLEREHRGSDPSPVASARQELRTGCWERGLNLLKRKYPPKAAEAAWVELLSEPESGWAVQDRKTGRWAPYCVPGYSPLCGDFIAPGCDRINPGGGVGSPTDSADPPATSFGLGRLAAAGGLIAATIGMVVYAVRRGLANAPKKSGTT